MSGGLYTLLVYIGNSLGVSPEMVIIITLVTPCLLFFAADFKLGLLSTLLVLSGLFIYFYQFAYQTDIVIILLLMVIVMLAFTLYFISAKVDRGVINP